MQGTKRTAIRSSELSDTRATITASGRRLITNTSGPKRMITADITRTAYNSGTQAMDTGGSSIMQVKTTIQARNTLDLSRRRLSLELDMEYIRPMLKKRSVADIEWAAKR